MATFSSKSHQAIDFDDERAVHELGKPLQHRVAAVAVDDEQLAAGLILPTEPRVRAERVALELYWTSALTNMRGVTM